MTSSPHYAVGIDVGGTTIKGRIVSRDGMVVASVDPVSAPRGDLHSLVCRIADLVSALNVRAEELALVEAGRQLSVGVCVPGIVDETKGIGVLSANLDWENAPLRQLISEALGTPIAFGHDVRCGALAEARWGVGEENCLYVAIGTGIASGLIMSGRLVPAAVWSGEIGQIPVEDPLHPGEVIPLEQVSSAQGLAQAAQRAGLVPQGSGAKALQLVAESESPHAQLASELLDSALMLLGEKIATVLHQIGAIPVVIGGGLSKGGERILSPIRQGIHNHALLFPRVDVIQAKLGADSQVLGAAALAFDASV